MSKLYLRIVHSTCSRNYRNSCREMVVSEHSLRNFLWIGLLASAVALVLLIVLGGAHHADVWYRLVEHFFTALAVACFLGLFVDRALKRHVVRDVFSAAIGYILPQYLRDELAAIYENAIVCRDHDRTVKPTPIAGTDFVKVAVKVSRVLETLAPCRSPSPRCF